VHGSYPFDLDYERLKCIMAIEEEIGLKQAEQSFKMHEQQEQQRRQMAKSQIKGQGAGRAPINKF